MSLQGTGSWTLAVGVPYRVEDRQKKQKLLDLTSRNIDVGQVAPERLVEVGGGGGGGGYSSNGRVNTKGISS